MKIKIQKKGETPTEISEITAFLETAYDVLNDRFFGGKLPEVKITIQSSPGAHGHFTPWNAWSDGKNGYPEINLGAETLNRPIEDVLATLQHECIHCYCHHAGIKDTSRGGTYHNSRFRKEAEARGLIIDYDSGIGHSLTTPAQELLDLVKEYGWQDVSLARQAECSPEDKARRSQASRKYQCPICSCSVRATKEVSVACMACNTKMLLVSI